MDAPSGPDFVQFTDAQHTPPRVVEFQAAKTEFQELTIARGKRLSRDQPFAVATPKDLIVLKLIAKRPQDVSDCVELAQAPGPGLGVHRAVVRGVGHRGARGGSQTGDGGGAAAGGGTRPLIGGGRGRAFVLCVTIW